MKSKILPSGIIIENKPRVDEKYHWYIKGTRVSHNEGEPAVEYIINKEKIWFQHGKYHRLDGPAIECEKNHKYYYIDFTPYSKKDYWNHPRVKEYLYIKEHPELEGFV